MKKCNGEQTTPQLNAFQRYAEPVRRGIVARLGWQQLRPVQELAAEPLMQGKNTLILAPTAGGKTEAALFPLLSVLVEQAEPRLPGEAGEPVETAEPVEPTDWGVGLLYIAPLRALLNNQEERLQTYAQMVGFEAFKWHGDVSRSAKNRFLREPTELLLITPESLESMFISSKVPHAKLFSPLQAVIVDEIHALAGADRGAHLMALLERLKASTRRDFQRVGLSATVGNPEHILQWLNGTSKRPKAVVDPPAAPSPKQLRIRYIPTWHSLAAKAAEAARGKKSLFFCPSRALAELIAEKVKETQVEVFVHHSAVSRDERAQAEAQFQRGRNTCIVCTSTLELGIDIGDLDRVFQAEAPFTVSSFLQRLGRTGRRSGQRANTTFFCTERESVLVAAALIELAKQHWVEPVHFNSRCWPVLVHQILARILQKGSTAVHACWKVLRGVPDFSGIKEEEYRKLVRFLASRNFIYLTGNTMAMGDTTENIFGRRNFMKLYSVFTTPTMYKVLTEAGYLLGQLDQQFVDKLTDYDEPSTFLLSGKPWSTKVIDHQNRKIIVEPAPAGKKPTWGGFLPSILSYTICQKIQKILLGNEPLPYLDGDSQLWLEGQRQVMQRILNSQGFALEFDGERALWWTFAGGQVNFTLKYGFEFCTPWKAVPDNLKVKLVGSQVTRPRVEQAIQTMKQEKFWNDPALHDYMVKALPNYRLSKFQVALPPQINAEIIGNMLLDVPRTISFIKNNSYHEIH